MARVGLLHGIDRERANGINAKLDHRVVLLATATSRFDHWREGLGIHKFLYGRIHPPDAREGALRGNPQHRRRFQPDDRSDRQSDQLLVI